MTECVRCQTPCREGEEYCSKTCEILHRHEKRINKEREDSSI